MDLRVIHPISLTMADVVGQLHVLDALRHGQGRGSHGPSDLAAAATDNDPCGDVEASLKLNGAPDVCAVPRARARWGNLDWVTRRLPRPHADGESRWVVFTEAARHDFLQAAAYLVLGAATAAALRVLLPAWVFEHLAGQIVLGVIVMALLAVVLALCSEADAFVAASLTMLPLLPRLVFLVVGPAVDVKLFAMQAGVFGRAFAIRFAPVTFLVATVAGTAVGLLVLGGDR